METATEIVIPRRFAGPPTMGHGGYVAGLFAARTPGAVQVTLKAPTPLDRPLQLLEVGEGRLELRDGDTVVTQSEPSTLEIDVPKPPTAEAARGSEEGSPSFYNDGRGVHPTCFGCGNVRDDGDALRIFAGPVTVDGVDQVAAPWTPGAWLASPDGTVDRHWVLAALDCPGAFAFLRDGKRAGLLGRIVFDAYGDVRADEEHVVIGWQIGEEGRKLFAGTALFGPSGDLLAAAKATWFGFPGR